MSDRVLLTRDGLAISVAGPEDDCIWLRDFLGAAYCSPMEERLRVEIALVPGLDVPTAATTRSRLAFVLDSGPVRLPAFPRADGERLLDAEATVAFDVGPGRYETTVRYGASRFAARVRLMRVVREYFHNHALQEGHLLLHAAAVVCRGRSVVIAGRKGAGKTTMMLQLLAEPETAFLSNDRVLVEIGKTPNAIGVPTVISLRDGTLGLMPTVATRLASIGDFRAHERERAAGGAAPAVVAGDVTRINAQQLCETLDCPSVPSAPLGAVIALDDADHGTSDVRRLDPPSAARMLAESLLGSRSGICTSEVFVAGEAGVPRFGSLVSCCERLASLVPCYRTGRLGLGTLDDVQRLLALCAPAHDHLG